MNKRTFVVTAMLLLAGVLPAAAKELILDAVQFPEDKKVDVRFAPTAFAAGAELAGKVEHEKAQAQVTLQAKGLGPALLHGGDVTSYVLWAVTRTGETENLGELWVDQARERGRYSTGQKEFALLVTAEAHPLVGRPSELVVFRSLDVEARRAKSTPFTLRDFAPPPAFDRESIAGLEYTGETPVHVLQAEKVFDLATEAGAAERAAELHHDARVTLAQAKSFASRSKDELALDYARRSLALSSEALRLIAEAEAVEAQIRERRREVESLESRATEAEARGAELRGEVETLRGKLAEVRRDSAHASAENAALAGERKRLDDRIGELQSQIAFLEEDRRALAQDKDSLENRVGQLRADRQALEANLQAVLSEIADTRATARGLIVTLPDILFDVDQATLKPEARTTLAKLAGVLLLMPELELRIEGHTDATGTEAHNLDLSRRRAESVESFLASEGVAGRRMSARGFGELRPVAGNDSPDGRRQNRRVEIVLPQDTGLDRVGEIRPAAARHDD